MVRRALVAGALLGLVIGLVVIHHDVLRLTAVWPVVLGFALWESAGARGSRGRRLCEGIKVCRRWVETVF